MLRGKLLIFSSAAAGLAIGVAGNNNPTIWNPAGSGRLFVPIRTLLGYVSTTQVAGHYAWAYQTDVGSAIATGAPITAFTKLPPVNALIGARNQKSPIVFATAVTFGAAPTYLRPTGLSNAAMAAATAIAPFTQILDEDGTLGLLPGCALQLCANAAVAAVQAVAIIGIDLPAPPGYES